MSDQLIEIVFSCDTTGSMYPCLAEARRKIGDTTTRLLKDIPNLKIGIIAHGDYCDARSSYVTSHLGLTDNAEIISDFIKKVGKTGGGDWEECYELVLREALTKVNWTPGSKRVLVIVGDAIPHPKAHTPGKIDWREELTNLVDAGVVVHGVQCLPHRQATPFYAELARTSGGAHLTLAQFSEVTEMFMAVAYHQQGQEQLDAYEEELVSQKKMTRAMADIFCKLSNRDPATGRYRKVDARAVPVGRFQKIEVESDQAIKDLVEDNGLEFERGRGFYEFTKRETIQAKKEVVILDTETGDMYQGDAAREVLGLPVGASIDISPRAAGFDTERYKVYVQSTSNNRKLIGGTTFLYETSVEA